ncbi:hypothetical protein FHW94_002609 [Novosphingobium sp. SG720]|nr:hypothetical protein [Novosphingobium sp. SG720]
MSLIAERHETADRYCRAEVVDRTLHVLPPFGASLS